MLENIPIKSFRGTYYFLSNMYPCYMMIKYDTSEYEFDCLESAYQALKTPEHMDEFLNLSGYDAKKLAYQYKPGKNWNHQKYLIMQLLIMKKFTYNKDLQEKLIKTYPRPLIEGNTWGDTYWGVCKDEGENMLGKLLMEARGYFIKRSNQNETRL